MGRELKRVPLDFDWPLKIPWGGYINPFYSQQTDCPQCKGSGSSPEAKKLKDLWYGYIPFKPEDRGSTPFLPNHPIIIKMAERNENRSPGLAYPEYCQGFKERAINIESRRLCKLFNRAWMHHLNIDDITALITANRLIDFIKELTEEGWKTKNPPYFPTPKEVNEWSISGFGHDSINQYVCVEAECKRLGYKTTCKKCNGDGNLWPSTEIKQQAENWVSTEPPIGDGYQIWETVSEGSPISPVFSTPERLAVYMEKTRFGSDKGTNFETWLKFIEGPGWAPSMIVVNGELKTGVEASL